MNKKRFLELWKRLDIYCYGSGEQSLLESFKVMFGTFDENHSVYRNYCYDYNKGIKALGSEALFWSLLTLLSHASLIDWGTSIRFGWTENGGTEFVDFVLKNTVDELYELIMNDDEED